MTDTTLLPAPSPGRSLLRILDLPAREALLSSKRSVLIMLSHAVFGAALIAGASLLARAFSPTTVDHPLLRADLLRPMFESLAIMGPSSVVLGTYASIDARPRTLFAAYAIGLLVAGVVVVAMLPLFGFLALVSRSVPYFDASLLVPLLALGSVASIWSRIVRVVDPSARARTFTSLANVVLLIVFVTRSAAAIGHGVF